MTPTIIMPGRGGSGETHWQSLWEARDPGMARFQPASWDQPELGDWMAAFERAVIAAPEPPLLVAHSLACLLVAHWAARDGRGTRQRIRGAFLVGAPDPDGPNFPVNETPTLSTFRGVPEMPLAFPTLVVASTDDPYATLDYAQSLAAAWGAGFVIAGALGHINVESGFGEWPQGAMLLEAFRVGTARP